MININHEIERYFRWLCDKVDFGSHNGYGKLANKLFNTDFIYIMKNDESRALDGEYLRYAYSIEKRTNKPDINSTCSILEMIIALIDRIEFNCWDSHLSSDDSKWFYLLLYNLDLLDYDDKHYDEYAVDSILDIFNNREYEYNGKRGLFPLKNPKFDSRKVDIYSQMCKYLNENNNILPLSLNLNDVRRR